MTQPKLWQVDIYAAAGQPDLTAASLTADAADLGIADSLRITAAHGYLLQGDLEGEQIHRIADGLLADPVVEQTVVAAVGDEALTRLPAGATANGNSRLVHVLPKPGVMDPIAQSAEAAIRDAGVPVESVRTLHKYWIDDATDEQFEKLCQKLLANDSVEQIAVGPLTLDHLVVGSDYEFELITVPIRTMSDSELERLSREGQLYLTLIEMQTIQQHFQGLERDPTDIELESIAQTWSEHCSHKTLAGRIAYQDDNGERQFDNMLKETIFAATQEIRKDLGDDDWCVSVFADNAGIVRFDDEWNVCFKVETHNHPSALEPYGGANTGIGGVIRDPMGTGMGAKPICNTDVFCFAPPDTAADSLPPGVLHPRRVMKGVVSGVRDYGNRMGIPTVNGAVYFDERYLGNPLVYCGNVGLIPREMSFKEPQPGDLIVALGGRTGRDGIHGATFSSAELTSESESLSGGAVQIGNAITEKMVLDVIMAARDYEGGPLYSAITDCGAGGFSSAVGEMGEEIGADVWLDKCPLKYAGLSYTEIWISEAQERMVLSVPEEKWQTFADLAASEGVEATVIGQFDPNREKQLRLHYQDQKVGEVSMAFLHDGRPPVVREATFFPGQKEDSQSDEHQSKLQGLNLGESLRQILGSLNVCSKEWVIRQYDHEVQGGSVIKPLVGVQNDGPSDAAVVRPVLSSHKGLAVSCGMNPNYGELDPYHMATSAIDEAVRNCVAVGADPSRIAILDNFCWGYTDRPETLGTLVRAALACYDLAVALGTPFISGKDSLNNEFSYEDPATGEKKTIAIPSTLLISAMGIVDDVSRCVTMDLKAAGNPLYLVGETKDELGGSHLHQVAGIDATNGNVPQVDPARAKATFAALHQVINDRLVRSCHDLSEGGLAVALAEMAFAGGLGVSAQRDASDLPAAVWLFSESNTRFVCEIDPKDEQNFLAKFAAANVPVRQIGEVTEMPRLVIGDTTTPQPIIDESNDALKEAWQSPLRW